MDECKGNLIVVEIEAISTENVQDMSCVGQKICGFEIDVSLYRFY